MEVITQITLNLLYLGGFTSIALLFALGFGVCLDPDLQDRKV